VPVQTALLDQQAGADPRSIGEAIPCLTMQLTDLVGEIAWASGTFGGLKMHTAVSRAGEGVGGGAPTSMAESSGSGAGDRGKKGAGVPALRELEEAVGAACTAVRRLVNRYRTLADHLGGVGRFQ
jgi:hypothetical protein